MWPLLLALSIVRPPAAGTASARLSSVSAQHPRHPPVLTAERLSDDAIDAKLASLRSKGKARRSSDRSAPPPPNVAPEAASIEDTSGPMDTSSRASLDPTRSDPIVPPPIERLREKVNSRLPRETPLDASAAAEIIAFLNAHLADEMLGWVLAATDVGKTARAKNAWSGGTWVPRTAELTAISGAQLHFLVGVRERGKAELSMVSTELELPREARSANELRELLLLLCDANNPTVSAKGAGASAVVLRIPGASDDWSLPDDLWLNTTPYRRSVRNMFYADVLEAMQAAVADGSCPRRMKLTVTPPELNMEMDSYRVGTLLELVRECALGFAELGMKTRVCVQGSMGEGAFMGVPRVLSGVRKVLTMMDWQAEPGEEYDGFLGDIQRPRSPGNQPTEGLVCFGAVGADEVGPDDDVLIVLAPQSMVGASIYEPLKAMTDKATHQGTSVILLNPLLEDRLSSSGVMSVRGRSDRLSFAASFEEIYHFRLLYSGTTFMFPILGSLRMARHAGRKYVLCQRRESGGSEQYVPVGCWIGSEPTPQMISELVPNKVKEKAATGTTTKVSPATPPSPAVEKMPWD